MMGYDGMVGGGSSIDVHMLHQQQQVIVACQDHLARKIDGIHMLLATTYRFGSREKNSTSAAPTLQTHTHTHPLHG